MEITQVVITFGAGLAGVSLGAWFSRRNEKRAQRDRLLVAALSDAVEAVADVVGGDPKAQHRWAGALARIALYASPPVIAAFRVFRDDATTGTLDGRERFMVAVQTARNDLGLRAADPGDIAVLLFGPSPPL